MPKKQKAECVVHSAEYRGDKLWTVEATFSDAGGTRRGQHAVEAPKKTTRDELAALVKALY